MRTDSFLGRASCALALAGLVALTACAGQPATSGPSIQVEDVWGRPTPKIFDVAAFYMVIRNTGNQADRLVGVQSPVCGAAELHETYQTDDGATGMRPVAGGAIDVPAGGQVALKPGSYHIMCLGKQQDFAAGDKLPLTLTFEKSGQRQVQVEIRQP